MRLRLNLAFYGFSTRPSHRIYSVTSVGHGVASGSWGFGGHSEFAFRYRSSRRSIEFSHFETPRISVPFAGTSSSPIHRAPVNCKMCRRLFPNSFDWIHMQKSSGQGSGRISGFCGAAYMRGLRRLWRKGGSQSFGLGPGSGSMGPNFFSIPVASSRLSSAS